MNFAEALHLKFKRDVFTDKDLKISFSEKSSAAILSGLSRALRSQDIVKLKRGVYVFGDRLRRAPLSKFVIANKLYLPSYVSFESALSFHGLIPEAVYTTTSACVLRKNKNIKTPIGNFSYDYIPCTPFFIGVESQLDQGAYLIASPIKALFDLVYAKKKTYLRLEDLDKDLRLDLDELKLKVDQVPYRELEILAHSYHKKITMDFFNLIVRGMK